MGKILSKKEAIRKLEESDIDFVMFAKYDEIVGVSTEPQQIEIEQGKNIITGAICEDIPYSENMFVKMLKPQTGKTSVNIIMF